MPLFNPIGLPIDLSTDVVGTLAYGNGGTNATTQRGARQNLGGWRVEGANSVPDGTEPTLTGAITGELGMTGYGNIWWWNSVEWRSRWYIGNLVVDGLLEGSSSTEVFISTGDGTVDVDNSLILQNKRSDRYAALVCVTHDSVGGASWRAVFGYGGVDSAVTFAGKGYIECNPSTDFVMVNNDPAVGRAIHTEWDGVDNSFRKWKQVGVSVPTSSQASFTLPGVKTQRVMELKSIETSGTGTVSATGGTRTITGTGTAFLTELQVGSEITVSGLRLLISSVASNTSASTYNAVGFTVTGQAYTIHSAVSYGTSADANLFTAIAANGTFISQVTDAPPVIWERYLGRTWGVQIGTANSNEFGISNLTANSQPFLINGDALNGTMRLTSTGATITGALSVSGQITSATKPKFSANKGGVSQVIGSGVWTKITFGTEVFDEGGYYSGSAWTPPSGYVMMLVSVYFSGTSDGERLLAAVRKGGVTEVRVVEKIAGAGQDSIAFSFLESTTGADVYEVYVFRSSGTSISGDAAYTSFQGMSVN